MVYNGSIHEDRKISLIKSPFGRVFQTSIFSF